jgi:hypothetical protein
MHVCTHHHVVFQPSYVSSHETCKLAALFVYIKWYPVRHKYIHTQRGGRERKREGEREREREREREGQRDTE